MQAHRGFTMIQPKAAILYFAPAGVYVDAHIVPLTADMAEAQIMRDWWNEVCLELSSDQEPIDRHWDWRDLAIEYGGRILRSEKLAIVTGDGAVQGAMLISTEAVDSGLTRGARTLFVELLFTAPRNRPDLRIDKAPYFTGVGTELLRWAADLSRRLGYEGHVRLDASPDFVHWYERRGLQKINANPIVFEGVRYTPMELPAEAANELLDFPPVGQRGAKHARKKRQ
jgi:hypothetical protein